MQPGHIRPPKRHVGAQSSAKEGTQGRTLYDAQRHRFSSSNLEDRSVTTDDPQFASNNPALANGALPLNERQKSH
jgi:hypothetical protein